MSELRRPRPRYSSDNLDLDGLSLLVTGATGSFGSRFVETVLRNCCPSRLIVFSRDELKQSEMAERLPSAEHRAVRFFIGDVRDAQRLEMAFRGVDVVIHAAALKQVPAAEYNPFECIHTNVLGAENIVNAAIKAGVKKVIALSTDKAVNPVNLYGASKLAAEKIFVAANNLSGSNGPRFSVVRYGNVLGSRGSVIPYFLKLISNGAPSLPITAPEMTRFWVTLQQSVDFVLSRIMKMSPGEIAVPKIPSMSMADMAKALAPDLPVTIVGIRPGEKLHESLITEDDARNTLEYEDHFVILPGIRFWAEHNKFPDDLRVPPGFTYTSVNTPLRLEAADLLRLLEEDGSWPKR